MTRRAHVQGVDKREHKHMLKTFQNTGINPALAAHLDRIVAQREIAGTNVHFTNERGEADRYSFASSAEADKFRAQRARKAKA